MCPVHEIPHDDDDLDLERSMELLSNAGPPLERLTIGVELECIVLQQAAGAAIPDDLVAPGRWMVTDANKSGPWPVEGTQVHLAKLLQNTVPIIAMIRRGRSLEWLEAKMEKFNVTALTEFPEYAMWQITMDGSIQAVRGEDPPGYDQIARNQIEFVSRILYEDNFDEVELFYRALREKVRIHVNSSCGYHVHVGITHLSLLQVKKLITVLMSFETLLFHIVAPHRRKTTYCSPLTTLSKAASNNHEVAYEHFSDEDPTPLGRNDENEQMNTWLPSTGLSAETLMMFRHIWNATTMQHIRDELEPIDREDPYSLRMVACAKVRGDGFVRNVDDCIASTDATLEFRHREATADPVIDRRWVELCVAIVRCAQLPQDEFIEVIRTAANANVQFDEMPSPEAFAALLGAVGLGTSVDFWRDLCQRYQDRLADPPAPTVLPPLP